MRAFEASRACELTAVRLYWPPEEAARYGLDDPWGGRPNLAELIKVLDRDLRRDAAVALGRVPNLRFKTVGRGAADALADEAALLGVDAIVIGIPRHRTGRWAELAPAAVLRGAAVPVLCVPESDQPARSELRKTKSILVATDLSDSARGALLPVYGLLREGGGHVELCTVHVPAPPIAPDAPLGSGLSASERAVVEARLRGLVPPEAEPAGVTTSVSVIEARSVPEGIVSAAERLGVDLVALGSHGRSGVTRAVLGSVADEVALTCSRPVLIVSDRALRERT